MKTVFLILSFITLLGLGAVFFHIHTTEKQITLLTAGTPPHPSCCTSPGRSLVRAKSCKTGPDSVKNASPVPGSTPLSPALSVVTENNFAGFFIQQLLIVFKK